MNSISLRPDPWMRWIYDYKDPRYNSEEAKALRDARDRALRNCPQWMLEMAAANDYLRENKARSEPEAFAD